MYAPQGVWRRCLVSSYDEESETFEAVWAGGSLETVRYALLLSQFLTYITLHSSIIEQALCLVVL